MNHDELSLGECGNMDMKHNVKQRRQERLKRLHAQDRRPEAGVPAPLPALGRPSLPEASAPELVPADLRARERNDLWNDPEYVWKQKMLQDGQGSYRDAGRQPDGPERPVYSTSPRRFGIRLLICAALFGGVWGMFQLDDPWAQTGRRWVTAALIEPMNTEALTAWYEANFRGSTSILPSFQGSGEESIKVNSSGHRTYFAPVKGTIADPFSDGKPGILLSTKQDAPVYAMDTGLVTFAGEKEGTGFTVVLRHPDGVETTYGWVADCKLEVNDWIKGGEAIGKASMDGSGGTIYFAVQKEGRLVNPADVVSIVP
ncbi:peptidoglycan DD-metalloendopeptidase family protein [Paenibacillus chartarius]|uniref:Peptidoglycan DD-metalloendopeptidase family protein n=1 Tax=Paenibacillus chartarius TaxID=747481 RepID=A0ABV6DIW6_9BACL